MANLPVLAAILSYACVSLVHSVPAPAGQAPEVMSAAPPSAAVGSTPSPAPGMSSPQPATEVTPPTSQNISAFFPQIHGDLTMLSWAHAVNSKALLQESLMGAAMMLEADVILGSTEDHPQVTPVMGHPPANKSDITLKEFLRTVVTHNKNNSATNKRKGIKLDFKSIEVFDAAIDEMKETFTEVPAFPVWLNADILPGPVNATATPVNATRFLSKAKQFPTLMLSLGWTTRWGSGLDGQDVPLSEGMYSQQDVDAMLKEVQGSDTKQPITYAVRAAFVANSQDALTRLLNNSTGNATLTVWMSDEKDKLSIPALRQNILALGKNRVFVDVPADIAKQLNLGSSSAVPTASFISVMFAAFVLLCGGAQ